MLKNNKLIDADSTYKLGFKVAKREKAKNYAFVMHLKIFIDSIMSRATSSVYILGKTDNWVTKRNLSQKKIIFGDSEK